MTGLVGIVLAAGASRRMGETKQLLTLHGRPLVQHALAAAAGARLDAIVVVLGHDAERVGAAIRLPANARVVVNARHAEGQSTSLACGLAAAGDEATAAVVLLGDQPHVTSALVDAVGAAWTRGTAPVVRPVWTAGDGTRHPGHPVVLGRAVWPAVAALRGDQGARAIFDAHPDWVYELAIAGAPLPDVDDRAAYRAVTGGV